MGKLLEAKGFWACFVRSVIFRIWLCWYALILLFALTLGKFGELSEHTNQSQNSMQWRSLIQPNKRIGNKFPSIVMIVLYIPLSRRNWIEPGFFCFSRHFCADTLLFLCGKTHSYSQPFSNYSPYFIGDFQRNIQPQWSICHNIHQLKMHCVPCWIIAALLPIAQSKSTTTTKYT